MTMLDNIELTLRARAMQRCLRKIAEITRKQKQLRAEARKWREEHDKLKAETKRARKGL